MHEHEQSFGSDPCKLGNEEMLDDAFGPPDSMSQTWIPLSTEILCLLLQRCTRTKDLAAGRQVYSLLVSGGFDSMPILGDYIVRLFGSCGSLLEANQVFYKVIKPSIYTWNAIISAHVNLGDWWSALTLYCKLKFEGLRPDRITVLWVLKACSHIGDIGQSRQVYDEVIRSGLFSDPVIGNAAVDMLVKCGNIEEAQKVFDTLFDRDVVSWGAMIAGYVELGHGLHALKLFEKMQAEGIMPDRVIAICVLKACSSIRAPLQGQLAHENIIRSGLEVDVVLGSCLMDMYSKCGSLAEAKEVFDKVAHRNVVSWGVIIGGYANHGDSCSVFELYDKMQEEHVLADRAIYLCILKACASIGALWLGQQIHDNIKKSGIEIDVVLGSAMVDMYAKCGNLVEAYKVLMNLPSRNAVAWGSLIAGFAMHGKCRMAGQCLQDMRQEGFWPDHMIFAHILTACSHAGLLNDGCEYFKSMVRDYGVAPGVEHYTCMVDLLGRGGSLTKAKDLLHTMPNSPDSIAWRALLSGCKVYCNVELGRQCFEQVVLRNSNDAAAYLLMSNIYADAHMWEDVDKLQELRIIGNAPKKPGRACVEIKNRCYEFIVGDTVHVQSSEIDAKLKELSRIIKQSGYMPQVDLVLGPSPDQVKEGVLLEDC